MAHDAYSRLLGKEYRVSFSNGKTICILFKRENFVHLAGLRKLTDLAYTGRSFSANSIFSQIKKGRITEYDLNCSSHYNAEMADRLKCICEIEALLSSGKAVFPFDKSKAHVRSRLRSDILFFRGDAYGFYLTFGVADDGKHYYPETAFIRFDNGYIRDQNVVDIVGLERKSLKE